MAGLLLLLRSSAMMRVHDRIVDRLGAHQIATVLLLRMVNQLARMHRPASNLVGHNHVALNRIGSLVIRMRVMRLRLRLRVVIARLGPVIEHLRRQGAVTEAVIRLLLLLRTAAAVVSGTIQRLRSLRMHPVVHLRRRLLLARIGSRNGAAARLDVVVVGRLLLPAIDLGLLGLKSGGILLRLLSPVSDGLEEGGVRLLRLLLPSSGGHDAHGRLGRLRRHRLRFRRFRFRLNGKRLNHFGGEPDGGRLLDGRVQRRFHLDVAAIARLLPGLPQSGVGFDALLGGCG